MSDLHDQIAALANLQPADRLAEAVPALAEFSDEELRQLCRIVHQEGYLRGFGKHWWE